MGERKRRRKRKKKREREREKERKREREREWKREKALPEQYGSGWGNAMHIGKTTEDQYLSTVIFFL